MRDEIDQGQIYLHKQIAQPTVFWSKAMGFSFFN